MTDSFMFDDQLTQAGPSTGRASATAAASTATDFSSSLEQWREIQLPDVQANLESLVPTLTEAQKESLLSRKKLAEQTREFKRVSPDEQPEAIKPLLKAYQVEIDHLTKRAKVAETAVLNVRDKLQGAKDPYPILELVLEQTAVMGDVEVLKENVSKLQAANASLEKQLSTLPSIEAERARLSNRVTHLEQSAAESRKSIEAELSAKWDERIRNHRAREENLQKSIELHQSQLRELRANYAKVTERLLHHGEEVEREQTNGKIEELDMLSEELSRSNERAAATERRNEQLRQEIERLKSGLGEDKRIAEAEQRLFDAEEENRRLSILLENQAKTAKAELERRDAKVRETENHLRERERESESLRRKIRSMADYDEVKRELEIFKYVEFAVESDFNEAERDVEKSETDEASTKTAAKPLEALLIEKNRQLQDNMTALRVAHNELTATSEASQRELEAAKREAERLKKLNERLEDDLISVKPGQSTNKAAKTNMSAEEALAEMDRFGREAGNGESAAVAPTAAAAPSHASASSPANPAPKSLFEESSKSTSDANAANNLSSGSSSSILPIITSQRDRFRARNAELEEELRKQFTTITELRNEVKSLQTDNLSLYEKVRYLQTYNAGSSAGSASPRGGYSNGLGARGTLTGGSRIVNMAAARNDFGDGQTYPPSGEDKYRQKYEASMNPFEQFRGREQSRALSSLNPLERILHSLTRIVLGHRRMRILFIVYALSLHLLVFAMLFQVEFSTGSTPLDLDGVTPAANPVQAR